MPFILLHRFNQWQAQFYRLTLFAPVAVWVIAMQIAQLNLVMAWAGILLGFLSGLYLGLNFQRDDWLGGYGSFKRRLYRLGHISFFGLAAVNFMFYFTVHSLAAVSPSVTAASWAFILGAVSMPLCCLLMAHFPRTHLLFGLPVASLIAGAILTVLIVARSSPTNRSADFQSAVSPTCSRQDVEIGSIVRPGVRSADYKSAIQQSITLRYSFGQSSPSAHITIS